MSDPLISLFCHQSQRQLGGDSGDTEQHRVATVNVSATTLITGFETKPPIVNRVARRDIKTPVPVGRRDQRLLQALMNLKNGIYRALDALGTQNVVPNADVLIDTVRAQGSGPQGRPHVTPGQEHSRKIIGTRSPDLTGPAKTILGTHLSPMRTRCREWQGLYLDSVNHLARVTKRQVRGGLIEHIATEITPDGKLRRDIGQGYATSSRLHRNVSIPQVVL
jgi:hypothetical protein